MVAVHLPLGCELVEDLLLVAQWVDVECGDVER